MSLVTAVLSWYRNLLQIAKLLGFAEMRYSTMTQKYVACTGLSPGRFIRWSLFVLQLAALSYYVIHRCTVESSNAMLNELEPGFRPPFVLLDFCEDMLMAVCYFAFCVHVKWQEKRLLVCLNGVLAFVEQAKRVMKRIDCNNKRPLVTLVLLMICTVLALGIALGRIVYERDAYWLSALPLCFVALFYHLQLVFYYLQLLLEHSFFAGMNKLMRQRLTEGHMRCLHTFLQLWPQLRRLHAPMATYFMPYMLLLAFRCLFKFGTFMASCKYDERTLGRSRSLLMRDSEEVEYDDNAAEEETVREDERAHRVDLTHSGKQFWILLRLVFLLAWPLAVHIAALRLQTEQNRFVDGLKNLINRSEFYENVEEQDQPTTSKVYELKDGRCNQPKIDLVELLQRNHIDPVLLTRRHVGVLKVFRIEFPIKVSWHFLFLFLNTLAAVVIADLCQKLEIRKLEKVLKEREL